MMTACVIWFTLNKPVRCHRAGGGEDSRGEGACTSWCGYSLSSPSQSTRGFPDASLPLTPHLCSVQSAHCLSNHPHITLNHPTSFFTYFIPTLFIIKVVVDKIQLQGVNPEKVSPAGIIPKTGLRRYVGSGCQNSRIGEEE